MIEHDSCKETTSLKTELRVIQRKYDGVVKKLKKMQQERGEKMTNVDDNSKDDDDDGKRIVTEEKERECELIKQKYEDVVKENEVHRKQAEELAAKCNSQLLESEHFRNLHLVGMNKCDQLVREAQMLNQNLNASEKEREKLKQDYEEIILLREQEKKEINELRGKRALIWNSETHGDENTDNLKMMNEKLAMEFQVNLEKGERLEEMYNELRKQFSEVNKELESSENERAYLRQQYAVTKRNLEKCMQENEVILGRIHQAEQHRDAAVKETDQALALQLKATRELTKLKEERNSALSEYRLVMSERDSVHKEMDKLQEDLVKAQEDAGKQKEETERLGQANEITNRDLGIVRNERDKAIMESCMVKKRMKELMTDMEKVTKDREKVREDCDMFREERDAARRERHEAIIHRDKILRECFEAKQRNDSFNGDSKDGETLRKQFDALSKELANALSEAEVSKKRRDWSFSERDKMVKERDAAKAACDVLRQERDRAVSDLAALLRDTDQIRREQSRSMEELKTLREKIKLRLDTNDRAEIVTSMDSAIDTDSCPDWETETVALKKRNAKEKPGFDLAASKSSIIVTNVVKGSMADGKLRVNDCLVRVNNVDVSTLKFDKAIEAINDEESLNITVKRKKLLSEYGRYSSPIHLNVPHGKELGILVDNNKIVSWIKPGSVADFEQRLTVGDKIVTVNGTVVASLSQAETEDLLSSSILIIEVQRPLTSPRVSPLESLLGEVDDKIIDISNIRQKAEFKEAMLADSLSAIQGSEKIGTSDISSALQSEIDDIASQNDNLSIFVPNTAINTSPSLTPLYEDKERTTGTQTGGPELATMSFGASSTHARRRMVPSTLESNTDDHVSSLDRGMRISSAKKKATRPKSAPVVRPDTLEMFMDKNRHHSGDTTLPRRNLVHPPISPSDPFSLTDRGNHLSGRPQALSPPAFNSRNVPYFATSRNVPYFATYTRGVQPTSSMTSNNQSHLSLPEDADTERSAPDMRFRTWTEPQRNLRSHDVRSTMSATPQTLPKSSKNRSSLPQRHRHKSSSSHNQSYNTIDTHSTVSSHSSCGPSSVGSSSGRNTPHHIGGASTPTFGRDIIHINQQQSDPGDKNAEKVRKLHIEKSSYPLGIQISQGSSGGIFVTTVTEGSIAQKAGLQYGDQILEFNGINFRSATYGQAAIILSQAEGSVRLMVQYNPQKLKENVIDNMASQNSSQASIPPVGDSDITPPVPRRFVPTNDVEAPSEPRYITTGQTVQGLGLNILGGNATGIFVCDVKTPGYDLGIRVGDQILEFNGFDFTAVTLEHATLELCKPSEKITMRAQYNPAKYNVIKDHPGDSLYVRAMFDNPATHKDQLSFKKDDILYITDTLYNGHVGNWKAWVVNKEDAQQRECGMIPSRMKADQIVLLRLSVAQGDPEHNKLAGRRSFFRRSKKGSHSYTVSHSRESSDTSVSTFTELGVASYQNVERLDTHHPRPVIILGPLADVVSKKLATGAPYKFTLCHNQLVSSSEMEIKKGVSEGAYLDYVFKDGQFYVTLMSAVREDLDKVKHSILEVSPLAIEKLRSQRIYPIVLFLKFKSAKHIKEQRDAKHLQQKVSTKDARAMYENSVRMEHEFRSEFTAVIPGSNINAFFSQIQDIVDEQQKKTLWIPIPSN
ncbi:disks large homolog 5-like isoform X2 [Dendronephthya gigantea]|nr:disks large homolog 5-like isoform X2 [Dendronephthya gigantea]XP_028405045.1 disks large homolog 5-like isoform X2 [Dendronephthya gigantea]